MTSNDFIDDFRIHVPGIALEPLAAPDQKTIGVPANSILDVCQALRERKGFFFLSDITAVDWWPKQPRYEVVYHLASADDRVRLKVALDGSAAWLPTIKSLWPAANWLEREVWDMFGIVFDGHGDLRRLLMPEDWEGHPLRKDFPVQIRLKPKYAEPLQVSEEEFRANLLRDKNERRTNEAH